MEIGICFPLDESEPYPFNVIVAIASMFDHHSLDKAKLRLVCHAFISAKLEKDTPKALRQLLNIKPGFQ